LIGNLVKNSTITHNPDIFSVTKETKKYEISHLGRTYKFLDTPGFCDTSGKDKSIISDMGEYIIESCRNVSQVWLLWSGVRLTPEIENVVRIIKDLLDLRTNKERLLIVRTHLANPDDFKEQEDKIISYFKNTFQLDITLTYYYTIKKDIKENTEKRLRKEEQLLAQIPLDSFIIESDEVMTSLIKILRAKMFNNFDDETLSHFGLTTK